MIGASSSHRCDAMPNRRFRSMPDHPVPTDPPVEDVDEKSRHSRSYRVSAYSSTYHGPTPPADYLRDLETIHPGFAARILTLTEQQQAHRHRTEEGRLGLAVSQSKSDFVATARGTYVGAAVVIVGLVIAAIVTLSGTMIVGGVFGVLDLAALASIFVRGRSDKSDVDLIIDDDDTEDFDHERTQAQLPE